MSDQSLCKHLNAITTVNTGEEQVCEECVKSGTDWVHLRTCQTCGVTLCCDESPQTHMTKHFKKSQHPVVASAQPGERWLWCYPDEQFVEY
jgi:uncharacterized UBP type Zn finger protein